MFGDCGDRNREADPTLSWKRKTKAHGVHRVSGLIAGDDQRLLRIDPASQDVTLRGLKRRDETVFPVP